MRTAHALLLDDNEAERTAIAELLGEGGALRVTAIGPRGTVTETVRMLEEHLSGSEPMIVLLDYRLDEAPELTFRGGGVAAALRDSFPDVPLVLLTTDEKLRLWVERRPGTETIFDWNLLKGRAIEQPELVREELADMATTWCSAHLATANDDPWPLVADLMAAQGIEELSPFIELEPSPPRADSRGALCRWLLHGPIEWPGVLLPSAEARVVLGVDAATFEKPKVQSWLDAARYVGALASLGRLYWRDRVTAMLWSALGETADSRPNAHDRATAVGRAARVRAVAECCPWCGEDRTVRSCVACRRAVDAAHSIRVLAVPPPWADPLLVCFSCVAEGRDEHLRYEPHQKELIEQIKAGKVAPPGG